MTALKVLLRMFDKYRWHLLALMLLGFVSALFEGIGINATIPLISFLLGQSSGTPTDTITKTITWIFGLLHVPFIFSTLLAFIVLLFVLRAVAVVGFSYLRGWLTADFFYSESRVLLGSTLGASWPFLLRQKLGDLHSTLVRDLQRTTTLLQVTGQIIQSFSGFVMYLAVAINISPAITLLTLGAGGVLLVLVRPFLGRIQDTGEEMSGLEKRISQFLGEHIIGMKSVKAAGAERPAYARGELLMGRLKTQQVRASLLKSLSTALFQPFTIIFVILLFVFTYKSGNFNIVAFGATLYLIQKIFTYLESGQAALQDLNELVPYAEHLDIFKQMLSEHKEEPVEGTKPFVFKHRLAFENVSLSYTGEPVLHDVSFVIPKGSTVAFIGPSGAGKTSVADLLLRLFEPTKGKVLLDDVDARGIPRAQWRACLGYVSQDVFLFNGTIRENIDLYRNLSESAIVEAAKQANIYEHIRALPQGFDTQVGDRGVMLSGGQRQRVALARVLAGKPEFLVLDEATSSLDTESERLIQESIRNLHGQVTVFIIAHRLSTVGSADRIFVLERGRIVEEGAPQELLQDPHSYYATHGGAA
jgi:ABC-type multidrug transport system fused ATPase/permease subunit